MSGKLSIHSRWIICLHREKREWIVFQLSCRCSMVRLTVGAALVDSLVSEQDTFISKPLSVQAGEDSLTVFWKVDEDCTAVPGRIKLTIVGISEDKTEVIKFDGREIMIKAAAYGQFCPDAGYAVSRFGTGAKA